MIDPITGLAALAPVLVEAGRAAVNRWLTPDVIKPANVDEYAKLKGIDLEWFKTLVGADAGGETYPWVEAIRKLQRPFVVLTVLGTWAYLHGSNTPDTTAVDNMASAVGFYLFGDRTMFYVKKAVGK